VKTPILAVVSLLLAAVAATATAEPAAPPSKDAATPSPEAAAAPKDKGGSTGIVRYANDKVTIDVKEVSAAVLVNEIASQAGAKVTGTVDTTAPVTATWTDLPLKDALEHILGAQNFTLTYSEQGALRAIQLRGGQQLQAGPSTVAPDDKNRLATSEYALFKAFDIREPIPVEGAVAKRLGKDQAPWDLLTNTAFADDDPAVRRSAVKAGMVAFEADEALREKVMGTANGMSDAQFAAFARAYMYHRAEDFVRNMKRTTTMPDLRKRASNVLRELRKIPFTGPIPVEGDGSKNHE
jgi:hypothetical protein